LKILLRGEFSKIRVTASLVMRIATVSRAIRAFDTLRDLALSSRVALEKGSCGLAIALCRSFLLWRRSVWWKGGNRDERLAM